MNNIAKELARDYNRVIYVVVRDYRNPGSFLYQIKSEKEERHIAHALEVAVSDNVQVIMTNSPESYGEYAPYRKFEDLGEFITESIKLNS